MNFASPFAIIPVGGFLLAMLLFPRPGQLQLRTKYNGAIVRASVGSSLNFTWSFSLTASFASFEWGIKTSGANAIALVIVRLPNTGDPVINQAYSGRASGRRSGDLSSGQVIFTLSSITLNDDKSYGCKIYPLNQIKDKPDSDFIHLAVEEAPNIILPAVASVNYNEGSTASISCAATGSPVPDVTWIHNGQVKNSGSKTAQLTFSKISRADAGMYTCRANNSVGTKEKQLNLVVNYKPEGTTITTSAAQNSPIQGETVTLTCTVTAAKPLVLEYRFYLNDSDKAINSDTNVNQYTIHDVQRSRDYGEYKCVASNSAGNGSDTVVLNIKVPARIQSSIGNVTVNEQDPIDLTCVASGHPVPTVTWTKDGRSVQSAKGGVIHIASTRRQDAGVYVCIADNGVGQADQKKSYVTVNYAATIERISSSVSKSWIGQTVTLTCVSDGVPTPTLSWYNPEGTKFNPLQAKENTVDVTMNSDKDFRLYNCTADNGFVPASDTLRLHQIKAPGSPIITSTAADIQASSMTVRWTSPADDGGSPITGYRVVILQGVTEEWNENVTDAATRSKEIGGLKKNTSYTVMVYPRNYVFEGNASQKIINTKYDGPSAAAEIVGLPSQTKDTEVTIKWNVPQSNGAPITQYTVYQRTVNDDGSSSDWEEIRGRKDPLIREVNVTLEKGKEYEFVVTATNTFGEGLKEVEKIKKIVVLGEIPAAVVLTTEVNGNEVTLRWKEPEDNGAVITRYSIYQRIGNKEQWTRVEVLNDISKREFVVRVEKDKKYEFVVTATNKYGESKKNIDNIKTVNIEGGDSKPPESQTGPCVVLHVVYNSVILVLGIIIIVLSVALWRKRRRPCPRCSQDLIAMNPMPVQEKYKVQPPTGKPANEPVTYATPELSTVGDYMPLHPSGKSWEISREQVNVIKIIGKGAFSQVAQATVRDIRGRRENITVAVKMLKEDAPNSDRKDLLSELELMKKLKPHPHVIKLIGCVTQNDPLLVLIEYVPFGDLLGYLRKSRGLNDTYYKDPDVKPQTNLTAEQLLRFAWQVADGMCYLSSKKIIHRDLAARNILVGEGEVCKVTDFGMARNANQDDIYTRKSRGRLPVKWTAYEALLYGTYTTQSDVWSYGILLYEILTVGGSPYPNINARHIARKIQEGYRMPKPRHVDSKLFEIMLKCWQENPTDRPTFDELRNTMKDMGKKHKTYVNLSEYDNRMYVNLSDLTAE